MRPGTRTRRAGRHGPPCRLVAGRLSDRHVPFAVLMPIRSRPVLVRLPASLHFDIVLGSMFASLVRTCCSRDLARKYLPPFCRSLRDAFVSVGQTENREITRTVAQRARSEARLIFICENRPQLQTGMLTPPVLPSEAYVVCKASFRFLRPCPAWYHPVIGRLCTAPQPHCNRVGIARERTSMCLFWQIANRGRELHKNGRGEWLISHLRSRSTGYTFPKRGKFPG